jgi:hypothetical protein
LQLAVPLLPQTDGILSLFNPPSHAATGYRGAFVLKNTIGSAASFWRRDVVEKMLANVPTGEGWDWRFCDFLRDAGYRIYVTRHSLVQHVGFGVGQNSDVSKGDYGIGFSDSSCQNGYFLIEQSVFFSQLGLRQLLDHINGQAAMLHESSSRLDNANQTIRLLNERLDFQQAQLQAGQAETRQLREQSELLSSRLRRAENLLGRPLELLFFRSNGRPIKPLRRLLFHASGKPRRLFRFLVLHKNGVPRSAFSHWMNSWEYLRLPKSAKPPDDDRLG